MRAHSPTLAADGRGAAGAASQPAEWRYGYELGQEVGLKAGSLYPILIRLAERGLLESRWEEQSGERPPGARRGISTGSPARAASWRDAGCRRAPRAARRRPAEPPTCGPRRERDLADRYLACVVRLLPAARREWGRAMRAELAAIDDAAERRRFALGCTRVVLRPTAGPRALGVASLGALGSPAGRAGRRHRPDDPGARASRRSPGSAAARAAFGPVRPSADCARGARGRLRARRAPSLLVDALRAGRPGCCSPILRAPRHRSLLTFLAAAFLAVTRAMAAASATTS